MYNKSLSYILLTAASLCISTQSTCMEKEISCYLNPHYYKNLMDNIEKQLVKKEIEKWGIDCIQKKIYNGIRSQIFFALMDDNKQQPILVIEKTFFKPKRKKDPLTECIYDAIDLHSLDRESDLPKKFLNNQIRYYWIKGKPAVLVKASLTNKEQIQEIIDKYKQDNPVDKEHIQAIDKEQTTTMIQKNNNNYQNVCFTVSAACLFFYLLSIVQVLG